MATAPKTWTDEEVFALAEVAYFCGRMPDRLGPRSETFLPPLDDLPQKFDPLAIQCAARQHVGHFVIAAADAPHDAALPGGRGASNAESATGRPHRSRRTSRGHGAALRHLNPGIDVHAGILASDDVFRRRWEPPRLETT